MANAMIDGISNGSLIPPDPTAMYSLPAEWQTRAWQEKALGVFRKRYREAGGAFHSFLLYAGVGSGKTLWSAMVAAHLLRRGEIDRVVFVCPNRTIRRRVAEEFRRLGIHLARWSKTKHCAGEPCHYNGVVVTYQALIRDHETHGLICDRKRTLVIFDEIHHLGDGMSWGNSAVKAFHNRAACVLGLSGTPYRGDNRPIPFVEYDVVIADEIRQFRPDFSYTLGTAVAEGVCRMPAFKWLKGEVRVTMPDGSKPVIDFDQEVTPEIATRRLNGAVRRGSASRIKALSRVVRFCKAENRKLIIFVGGDSKRKDAGGVSDATKYLPAELARIGIPADQVCHVVSDDPDSADKIAAFGKSGAWVLIAVNMISEGVDIPELSVALFLTTITARCTTIQRIGRVLRGQGEAHIFMFEDYRYKEIAAEIMNEIRHEIDLGRECHPAGTPGAGTGNKADGEPLAEGLDCREGGVTVNGVYYSEAMHRRYFEVVEEEGLPRGMAFMSMILPLIARGRYGPVPNEAAR